LPARPELFDFQRSFSAPLDVPINGTDLLRV